ncbi:MAG: hypothetical protein DWQ01_09495 [Planctomycetota bacterium]|nr:MAG: hypothetical protein DWQ01_09495 [Planctomycetota bacterium]
MGLRTLVGWIGSTLGAFASLGLWAGRQAWAVLRTEAARQTLGAALGAIAIFTFVALMDFRAGAPADNVCGSLGYGVANWLLRYLGVAAFLPPLFGAFWGLARMIRRGGEQPWVKALGTLVLTLTVATAAYGLDPDHLGNRSFPRGFGGYAGAYGFPKLEGSLGPFGVAVLLVALGLVSLFLATEWAFVPLIRELLERPKKELRQPELPLQPGQADAAGQSLWQRWRESVAGLFRPFLPGEERLATAGAAVAPAPSGTGAAAGKKKSALRGGVKIKKGVAASEEAVETGATTPSTTEAEAAETEEDWPQEEGGEYEEEDWEDDGEYEDEEYAEYEDEEYDPEDPEQEDAEGWEEEGDLWEEGGGEEGAWEKEEPAPKSTGEFSLPGIADQDKKPAQKPSRRKKAQRAMLKELPTKDLLKVGGTTDLGKVRKEIDSMGRRLQDVFDAFGLDARVVGAERGPTLTLFEVQLASGVSVKKLKNQRDDLAVALGSHGVRIVYPLPGRTTVGVEVPNMKRETVLIRDVFEEMNTDWNKVKLPMVLGRDTLGRPATEDLTVMPHMLVAGTTGSGKSVCLNSILCSWLLTRSPEQLRLVLIDPKQVELQLYKDIPHLLCPVVTDMKRAPFTLEWATRQMEDRLHMFKLAGVRNIKDYNGLKRKGLKERLGDEYDATEFPSSLPYIVLVIDELADLMLVSAKEVEIAISRLAAKARAAGIHLLVATQRPSTDVVTGLIKMNLPVRLGFKVTSAVDSRVILDESGAEDLLGNGDFLYRPPGASGMLRGQGAFVSEKEVRSICDFLRANGKPEFLEDLVQMKGPQGGGEVDDPLYEDAVRIILQSGRGSASLLQRALSIGYTRASRLVDIMTEQGVLGPHTGSKAREVLLSLEEWEAQLANR